MVGFGLVVGLNNTGSKSTFTQQVAVDMLQRFMVTTAIKGDNAFKSGNISAVIVTTELGPYARVGSRDRGNGARCDDATSLDNGTLVFTPLKGVDGGITWRRGRCRWADFCSPRRVERARRRPQRRRRRPEKSSHRRPGRQWGERRP